ncbi:2660_t:CDS:2 [Funneliformis mosseae]|uniref:2660_t:CDS:1 n=1 Tax=Funneliformis mosseae TaxID=27381 RepID=A0A9N9E4P5_FUNMO|nr:2660_t:CDS:2 [Funneliformis mosseae]
MSGTNQGGLIKGVKDFFSGTIGGIVQRLQTQPYNGTLDCVRQTSSKEGLRGFYKGSSTPLVGYGTFVSIQFFVFGSMQRLFNERNERNGQSRMLTMSQLYLAGAASGIISSFVSCPVEHIRTRLQVQRNNELYNGPIDCIKKIYSKYHIKGIYKGQFITMARELHGCGCYFLIYEYLMYRAMFKEQKKRDELPSWKHCLYGAAAGYGLWGLCYPIDVIKSKIQTDEFSKDKRKYSSSLDCAKQTFAKEGIKGFFKGFGACILRAGPVNASSFVAIEITKKWFDRKFQL